MALGTVKAGRWALRLVAAAAVVACAFVALKAIGTPLFEALAYFPSRTLARVPADEGLTAEELSFAAEDGVRLHGFWIPAREGSELGPILFCHGNAGNVGDRVFHARLLHEAGFGVLLFDYRGYGRSEGSPGEEGTYRDARAALARLASLVPGRAPVYLGESLGGGVAAGLAEEQPPRALVLQSTFTSIRAMARRYYPILPGFMVPDAYPTLRRLARIDAPVLVAHGERDSIVPVEEARALYAAAREPRRLLLLPGVGHNDFMSSGGREFAAALAEWVRSLG